MEFVTVNMNNNGTVPAISLRASGGKAIVRFACGKCLVVDCTKLAPATQPEIMEYIAGAAKYETK